MDKPVTLWREIDALGGVPEDEFDRGYDHAIGLVLAVLEKHGHSEFVEPGVTYTHPGLDPSGRAQRLRNAYADAVGGLRYIEQEYGRLKGVGWDRVFDAFHDLVVIPEREGLPAGFSSKSPTIARRDAGREIQTETK